MITYLLFIILAILLIILFTLIFRNTSLSSSRLLLDEFSKLYEKLGGLDRENKEILELTKSFHNVLKPTKARGILGENILENLLRDILPKEVIIPQLEFKDGKRVDFAIKLPEAVVPIDAKFSLEAFKNYFDAPDEEKERQRRACIESIKKRITETAGYIYPDEGTTDFALMYVPSEAVYYFIITETQLLDFSHQKKVFIVGPSTFYAYLKTIFIGFQAMKIEKKAKQIYNDLKRLEKDTMTFRREFDILGSHIRSASLKYEEVSKRVDKISSKLQAIGDGNDDGQSEA